MYLLSDPQAQLDKAKDQLSRKMLSTIKYLEHESYREKYRISCREGGFTSADRVAFTRVGAHA